mmetsp:Transcript_34697/g.66269  ORF Transcript_34697/g.66269 Transcript_34697/m.66269 type:complete len:229 (+) Transcript_34697:2415-3101(+)
MDGEPLRVHLPAVLQHPVGHVFRGGHHLIGHEHALPLQVVEDEVVQGVQHLQAVHLVPEVRAVRVQDDLGAPEVEPLPLGHEGEVGPAAVVWEVDGVVGRLLGEPDVHAVRQGDVLRHVVRRGRRGQGHELYPVAIVVLDPELYGGRLHGPALGVQQRHLKAVAGQRLRQRGECGADPGGHHRPQEAIGHDAHATVLLNPPALRPRAEEALVRLIQRVGFHELFKLGP